MKLKLLSPISYKNALGEEETTEYIFIKKPTVGDLTKKQNIGILSSIIHKAQRYLILGQKTLADSIQNIDEKEEENKEAVEALQDDTEALSFANSNIYGCIMGGYNDVEKDLLEKGQSYFDRFLFVDEELKQSIQSNLIKEQLNDNGDLLDLYKIVFGFFFQASLPSQTRKIEI